MIHEIYKDGAAEKDGRLKPGDRLVSVNGTELKGKTHKEALRILRSTNDKVRGRPLEAQQTLFEWRRRSA